MFFCITLIINFLIFQRFGWYQRTHNKNSLYACVCCHVVYCVWQELYRNAYTLVLHKHGDMLYDGVGEYVTLCLPFVTLCLLTSRSACLRHALLALRHVLLVYFTFCLPSVTFCLSRLVLFVFSVCLILWSRSVCSGSFLFCFLVSCLVLSYLVCALSCVSCCLICL